MMKSEMSEDQLADRAAFVERVSKAGWDLGGWEQLFEGGADLEPEAQAEYRNSQAFLRLSYHAKSDYVLLECGGVRAKGGKAGNGGTSQEVAPEAENVSFYPIRDVGAIVDKIVAGQDKLSLETLPRLVKKIKPMCNYVIMETPDGLKFL